jgi:arylformamidase
VPIDPFRIRDHVADFDAIVADLRARSAAALASLPMAADVAYGAGASESLDLFFPPGAREGSPVHMFIHGGYWRMFSKRDYAYVAETVTSAGAIAVIVDYALMPKVRMADIVDQIRRAGRWTAEKIAGFGGDPTRFTVSGHSAGAHLATFLFHRGARTPQVQGALLVGGLYDLAPLQSSFLKDEIAITDEEVAAFTPLTHAFDPATRVAIVYGEEETPPFHAQAADFAEALRRQGLTPTVSALKRCNHMSSVRDLGVTTTEAADALRATIGQS